VGFRPGRVRRKGGGRKRKTLEDPTLAAGLKELIEPATRGAPTRPPSWTTRTSWRRWGTSPPAVGDVLRRMGYSLQANSTPREGGKHIDRDARFLYIDRQAKAFSGCAPTGRAGG
jgi:hypothetical protein